MMQAMFSDDFKDLVTGMLHAMPHMRYTMNDIVNHPWTQGQRATNDEITQEFFDRELEK